MRLRKDGSGGGLAAQRAHDAFRRGFGGRSLAERRFGLPGGTGGFDDLVGGRGAEVGGDQPLAQLLGGGGVHRTRQEIGDGLSRAAQAGFQSLEEARHAQPPSALRGSRPSSSL